MDTRTIPHRLLLDVGGTFIKCSDGRSVPIDSDGTREEISSSLNEAVGNLSGTESIAVAIPGPFDYGKGIFMMKHKFASVYGESFASLANIPETVKISYIHDVNCMLLGEMTSGAARNYENAAIVSIGTGLGFAMSINREIQKSPTGSPAVVIYYRPYEDGIVEDYVSKRGITRLYSILSGETACRRTVKEIADMAHSGNRAAAESFSKAAHILGKSVAPVLEEYNVGCLLFGGQISKSYDLMEQAVGEELAGIGCLKKVSTVSDFDNATFNGLKALA